MPPAIVLERASKRFKRYRSVLPSTTLKAEFLDWLRGRPHRDMGPGEFEVIHDASFAIEPGEAFGIIGRNGAGKSTLLKLIAGIYKPDSGSVRVQGRIAALIELGAGFHPEFTGAENIVMNAMMLGLSRAEARERFDDIVDFAGIGEFIDAPVRTYSSGMYGRLAFSVAIHVQPDVLLVDEILSVGDETFQAKCLAAIEARISSRSQTTVIVSHDMNTVTRLCHRAALVEPPQVCVFDDASAAVDAYHRALYPGTAVVAHADPYATVHALESDLDEIAKLLDVAPGTGAALGGPGRTARGRAILQSLLASGTRLRDCD